MLSYILIIFDKELRFFFKKKKKYVLTCVFPSRMKPSEIQAYSSWVESVTMLHMLTVPATTELG